MPQLNSETGRYLTCTDETLDFRKLDSDDHTESDPVDLVDEDKFELRETYDSDEDCKYTYSENEIIKEEQHLAAFNQHPLPGPNAPWNQHASPANEMVNNLTRNDEYMLAINSAQSQHQPMPMVMPSSNGVQVPPWVPQCFRPPGGYGMLNHCVPSMVAMANHCQPMPPMVGGRCDRISPGPMMNVHYFGPSPGVPPVNNDPHLYVDMNQHLPPPHFHPNFFPHEHGLAESNDFQFARFPPNDFGAMHERIDPRMLSRNGHIKKPLNAFMLFMREMRPKVLRDCGERESTAINQIIGKQWQAMSKEDQAKYYEMAKREKDEHQKMFPNWTPRDQYHHPLRRRRRRERTNPNDPILKKCRARFGLEHQDKWCKPCRRKKKCIRFSSDNGEEAEENNQLVSDEITTSESTGKDNIHEEMEGMDINEQKTDFFDLHQENVNDDDNYSSNSYGSSIENDNNNQRELDNIIDHDVIPLNITATEENRLHHPFNCNSLSFSSLPSSFGNYFDDSVTNNGNSSTTTTT